MVKVLHGLPFIALGGFAVDDRILVAGDRAFRRRVARFSLYAFEFIFAAAGVFFAAVGCALAYIFACG